MKKNIKWFLLGLIIFYVFIYTDFSLAQEDKAPIFAIHTVTYKDGGTKEYMGLGYKIIRYSIIEGRQDTDFGTWLITYNSQSN
jgi:hypothetical protein